MCVCVCVCVCVFVCVCVCCVCVCVYSDSLFYEVASGGGIVFDLGHLTFYRR